MVGVPLIAEFSLQKRVFGFVHLVAGVSWRCWRLGG
jgi:hypothetical protein